jgi:tetratricopeptide (TPR) repeat protein
LASLVDVAPTILGRLGLDAPPGIDGVDLFSPGAAQARGVYFESYAGYLNYGWSPLSGWVDAAAKYLHGPAPELYRPDRDPGELLDLSAEEPEACARARERIAEVFARPVLASEPLDPGAELARELARLGYAQAAGPRSEFPSPLEPSDRPGARERAGELAPLLEAHALFEARRFAEAEPLLAAIVAGNRRHVLALDLLALCRMHAGDFGRARELLLQRLQHAPPRADALINLAICHEMERDFAAAVERYREAERLVPGNPEVAVGLARAVQGLQGSEKGPGSAVPPSGER